MLTPETISTIKATVPAVQAHAQDITAHFYPLMFERYPAVKAYFNQAHQAQGTQPQALANAVIAYAANIDNLQVLGDAVNLIAHKHCALHILPEHYPIVGECLLDAIAAVLGDAATPEVLQAWGDAYGQLADILIQAEEEIYRAHEQRNGGWRGEKAFKLVDKVAESDVITSFYLAPEDTQGTPIDFLPGQYIGLVMEIDGQTVRRNYSLSQAPGADTLRISVKREPGGLVSNYLHDKVAVGDSLRLTAPCGDFVLPTSQRPLFLVTGGVGITPALSMMEVALQDGRPITFVHAAQNGRAHAFRERIQQLAEQHPQLQVRFVYDQALPEDQPHARGFVSRELLEPLLPSGRDVDFYFLGPKPFMQSVMGLTRELSIPEQQVRYEFFGPLEQLA